MPVVSNTSPILNIAIIDRLSLLHQQYPLIYVPPAVRTECRLDEDLPGVDAIRRAFEQNWIQEVPVEDTALVHLLERELDRGEAEAIALAKQLESPRVLLDEKEGRKIAGSIGLQVTGIVGILLKAHKQDINTFKNDIDALRTQAGFYLSDAMLLQIISEIGLT